MKFILTIILIFVLVPRSSGWLSGFLSNQVAKAQRQVHDQQRAAQRHEGRINVDRKPPSKDEFKGGDYVDYEEVKD